jgi:hypothetical protein
MSNPTLKQAEGILPTVFGSFAGAISAGLIVVMLGLLEWEFVRGIAGVAIGALIGTSIAAAFSAAISNGDRLRARVIGGLGGFVAGGIGAFCAIASAEMWRGLEWAVYGGLYGAFVGSLMGGITAALVAWGVRLVLLVIRGRKGAPRA